MIKILIYALLLRIAENALITPRPKNPWYTDGNIMGILIHYEIIPLVIDVCPEDWVNITYPSGVVVQGTVKGHELYHEQIDKEPLKVEWPCQNDTFYTLAMVDVDNEEPFSDEEMYTNDRHWYAWLVGNIDGNECNFKKGDYIFPYYERGVQPDKRKRRYVFFIFEQPYYLDDYQDTTRFNKNTSRTFMDIMNFVPVFNLSPARAANIIVLQTDNATVGE